MQARRLADGGEPRLSLVLSDTFPSLEFEAMLHAFAERFPPPSWNAWWAKMPMWWPWCAVVAPILGLLTAQPGYWPIWRISVCRCRRKPRCMWPPAIPWPAGMAVVRRICASIVSCACKPAELARRTNQDIGLVGTELFAVAGAGAVRVWLG